MDCRDRAVRRLRLRHPRVQLRPLRGAQERDRLGLSRVESQGGWLRELWLRHGGTQRPAASPNGDRDSARPDSLIGPHPCRDPLGSLPGRRRRRRTGRAGGACPDADRRSAVVDRGLEGGAGQMNTTTEARARRVAYRTRGHSHGSITRLVSPSDVGRLIKPFVFLDYFDIDPEHTPAIGFHPHSGIATLTVLLEGLVSYEETSGTKGIIEPGGVEWMRAGGGVWHTGGAAGTARAQGYQLWIALPPAGESPPSPAPELRSGHLPSPGPAPLLPRRPRRAPRKDAS